MKKLSVLWICILIMSCVSCSKKELPKPIDPGQEEEPDNSDPVDTVSLVYLNSVNKLLYNKFANKDETNKENTIPDFSNVGYMGGGVALPEIPVRKTLAAVAGDNRLRIQQAIDEVGNMAPDANGFRGAVLLLAGLYEVEGTIRIANNGVVLKGVGQSSSGTILHATKREEHTFLEIAGSGSGYGEIAGTRTKINTPYVPTGANSFVVESALAYKVGDNIAVYRVPNEAWITALNMTQYGWSAQDYAMAYERQITAVNGNTITINAPIVDPIQTKYGGGYIFKINITNRVSHSGIENLRLTSYYAKDDDENHARAAIKLRRAENCWVKQVTAKNFGHSCVTIANQSVYNTIEECAMLDPKSKTAGGNKYSFNIEDGSLNLFQRCFTRGGRHDYITGSQLPGPNVFLDCYSTETYADIGPHQRWATGTLLDNIHGGELHVENRKSSGTGHGWAGAQTLFWNCKSYQGDVVIHNPTGGMNWAIGCVGLKKDGNGFFQSWNLNVTPRSIYLAQLQDRLGNTAINNITTPSQRSGNIFELLKNWAGEGKL